MKFIVYTQLPPKLSQFLEYKGLDSIHTTQFDNGHLLSDEEIVTIAIEQDRIIISKDADFSDYFYLKGAPPKILLLHFGNISNNDLISYFKKYLENILEAFLNGYDYVQFNQDGIVANKF
jgi:predicted nuclease of predicted toxin-antitoxin system